MKQFRGFDSIHSHHHAWFPRHLWFGRGRHGHGREDSFSRSGRGPGGDDGFMRGRQFGSDDLQLLIMALLADAPRHGYELIKMLETRSKGFYVPSPGMVYPALTYLEEVGHTSVETDGNRKRYALTDTGKAHLESKREHVDLLLAKLSFFGKKMEMIRRAMSDNDADGSADERSALRELLHARQELKAMLMDMDDASADQQLRTAEILKKAKDEITAVLRKKHS